MRLAAQDVLTFRLRDSTVGPGELTVQPGESASWLCDLASVAWWWRELAFGSGVSALGLCDSASHGGSPVRLRELAVRSGVSAFRSGDSAARDLLAFGWVIRLLLRAGDSVARVDCSAARVDFSAARVDLLSARVACRRNESAVQGDESAV
jgi:hypothetical protein